MATRIRVSSSGPPSGIASVVAQIRQEIAREVGEATIRRTARRINDHPAGVLASNAMSVEAGAGMATIVSPMGNPGRIPGFRDARGFSRWGKRAMWWPGARRPVKWIYNYKGLRPLLEAEMSRVENADIGEINFRVR
jgi:hypothetical protein